MNENLSHPLSNTPVGAATVAVRRRWYAAFQLVGAVVGALSAFVIGPIGGWLLSLIGDAPGPLRLAAELPLAWAIPALAILGAIVGLVLVAQWHEDAGTVLIDDRGITVADKDGKQRVLREDIQSIFTDGKDLIIDDLSGHERLRKKADDELATQLPAVLENFDYRYLGTNDPQEAEFAEWVDGELRLDDEVEALLRARHRAALDKKPGSMQELREQLASQGIIVRDRDGGQQFRPIGPAEQSVP